MSVIADIASRTTIAFIPLLYVLHLFPFWLLLVIYAICGLDDFFVAKPTDDVQTINNALARGENLLFTPGVYHVDKTIKVKRPDTWSHTCAHCAPVPSASTLDIRAGSSAAS